jgi:hypothetical protein
MVFIDAVDLRDPAVKGWNLSGPVPSEFKKATDGENTAIRQACFAVVTGDSTLLPLCPLLREYHEGNLESLCFYSRRSRQRVDYLDYLTGETVSEVANLTDLL